MTRADVVTVESIAAELRAERKARGLTLAQVAERAGVSLQKIHEWETGKSRPWTVNLITWAGALGLDVQLARKTGTPQPRRPVNIGTGMPATTHLEAFGQCLRDAFAAMPYHVGSSIYGKTWRDVDVRLMLDDDRFDALFPGYAAYRQGDAWWSLLCSAISELGRRRTGLPIDFQVQRTTEANEMFSGARNPLFVGHADESHRPEMLPCVEDACRPDACERCGGVPCSECGECPRQGCWDCQCAQRDRDDEEEPERDDD